LIKELGCGGGVHDVGPDLFLGGYGSFWHGVVRHPRVELAAGYEAEDGRDEPSGDCLQYL
jgi:hypothetical protein